MIAFGTKRKRVYDFLLAINSYLGLLTPFLRYGDLKWSTGLKSRIFLPFPLYLAPLMGMLQFDFLEKLYVSLN